MRHRRGFPVHGSGKMIHFEHVHGQRAGARQMAQRTLITLCEVSTRVGAFAPFVLRGPGNRCADGRDNRPRRAGLGCYWRRARRIDPVTERHTATSPCPNWQRQDQQQCHKRPHCRILRTLSYATQAPRALGLRFHASIAARSALPDSSAGWRASGLKTTVKHRPPRNESDRATDAPIRLAIVLTMASPRPLPGTPLHPFPLGSFDVRSGVHDPDHCRTRPDA